MPREPGTLETFPNPHPDRDYLVHHHIREFTSLCPKTGQPDFAEIHIHYAPSASCIELKSLKLYCQRFRNEGVFYEDATNIILKDLAGCCAPKWMRIVSRWSIRGGIRSSIVAEVGARPPQCPEISIGPS